MDSAPGEPRGLSASWWGNGPPRRRRVAGLRGRSATLGLRHGPDSYGRQQWGILRNGRKPDAATPREQRLHPPYYRGCWHGVSRCLLKGYRQGRLFTGFLLLPPQSFTILRPSSLTRRGCVRLSPIAQYSPLLPPVGVWTVSQFQCG